MILLFLLLIHPLTAQNSVDGNDELKIQIEKLTKENDILTANQFINKNLSFDPKYILEILNRNLKYAKEKDKPKELASTYYTLGNFWHTLGNKSKAFENYLNSESISRSNNNLKLLGFSMRNRATLVNNTDERLKLLEKSIKIFEEIKDSLNLAISQMNTGVAHSTYLNWETPPNKRSIEKVKFHKENAFKHFNIVENLNKHLKNDDLSAALNTYYGEWFVYERNFREAKKAYEKVLYYSSQTNQLKGKVNALIQIAYIDKESKNYIQAIKALNEAEELSKTYGFNDHLVDIYDQYAVLYDSTGNPKKSLEYTRLYAKKALELSNTNNEDKIQIVSLEHNLAENELKIEKYETQTKFNQILILFGCIILIFITGISYLIIKNNRKKIESLEKNKIITEIQLKNQRLEDELLKEKVGYAQNHLVTIANLSNKILNFLDELKIQVKDLSHNTTYQKGINDLRVSFSKILNDKSYLTELNTLSSEVNQGFFIYIRKNYPEVTKKDEQLLSFIIMNMTSKEIGKILNISTESVYIKRHRLRKKLKLKNNDSIPEFYEEALKKLNL